MAVATPTRLDLDPTHVPFTLTATLRTGVGIDQPYGLDLAGLIAARVRRVDQARLDRSGMLTSTPLPDTTEEDPPDLRLPLGRCLIGPDWHWLASCAILIDADPDPEPRTFYQVADIDWASRTARRPLPHVNPSSGSYRDVMMPAPVAICSAIQWRGVGDPDQVAALMRPVRFVGRRRTAGEGRILQWHLDVTADADPATWGHLDDNADLARPCPTECAETLDIEHRIGWYAIRPPSWHPDRLRSLAMKPEQELPWL